MTNEEIIERAYAAVPEPKLSTKFRVAIAAFMVILFSNSALAIYNTHAISTEQSCNIKQQLSGRKIAADDRSAVDLLVSGVVRARTQGQLDQAFSTYTAARKVNDAARAKAYAENCQNK